MCFVIPMFCERQIADEDKIVYKTGFVVKNKYFDSAIRGYRYILNKENPFVMPLIEHQGVPVIDKGYHSYGKDSKEICHNELYDIVECIIPKDSVYYYNGLEDTYVSSNIIIKQQIDKKMFRPK